MITFLWVSFHMTLSPVGLTRTRQTNHHQHLRQTRQQHNSSRCLRLFLSVLDFEALLETFAPHSLFWWLLAKEHGSSDQEEVRSACRNPQEKNAIEYLGQDLHILSSFCKVCEDRELGLLEQRQWAETPLQENGHSCEMTVWLFLFHWWPTCGIKHKTELN